MIRPLFFVLIFCFSAVCQAERFVFTSMEDIKLAPEIVSVIDRAYANLGHAIEVKYLPAKRALMEADQRKKKYDGELARTRQVEKEIPNLVRVPVMVSEISAVALSVRKDISIQEPSDLQYFSLGAIRGIAYTEAILDPFAPKLLHNLQQGRGMLLAGRIDLFVMPDLVASHVFSRQEDQEGIIAMDLPFPSIKVYHYVNKRHQAIVGRLANELSNITGNPIERD